MEGWRDGGMEGKKGEDKGIEEAVLTLRILGTVSRCQDELFEVFTVVTPLEL
jgi:hypothetical protein